MADCDHVQSYSLAECAICGVPTKRLMSNEDYGRIAALIGGPPPPPESLSKVG